MTSHPTKHIDWKLAERLQNDPPFRDKFIRAWARTDVATELKAMRTKRRMKQVQLADLVGTGQSAISRSEQADYEGWTFKTLLNIACALKARLRITLEPIEDVAAVHAGGRHGDDVAAASAPSYRSDSDGASKEYVDSDYVDSWFDVAKATAAPFIDHDNASVSVN